MMRAAAISPLPVPPGQQVLLLCRVAGSGPDSDPLKKVRQNQPAALYVEMASACT